MEWLQIIYLAMVLGLALSAVRSYQLGARRIVLLGLIWACIFMVAAGIAAFVVDDGGAVREALPSADAPVEFT